MIEQFIDWYLGSDSFIHERLSNAINYAEYSLIFGALGVIAVLIEVVRNAVKHKQFTISNQFIVGVLLLFIFGASLKPLLDFVAYSSKQLDLATNLSEKEKAAMKWTSLYKKKAALSSEVDTLLAQNDGAMSIEIAQLKVNQWITEQRMAQSLDDLTGMNIHLSGATASVSGLGLDSVLDEILGAVRSLLKIYYISMMNVIYMIIPLSYVFSIFKPSHFLKPLGIFVLYAFVLTIINGIEYVMYLLFLSSSVDNAGIVSNMGSLFLGTGCLLWQILSCFIYLRAMWVTRLVIPISGEDTLGPMVGQAFVGATFLAMKALKLPVPQEAKAAVGAAPNQSQGPVDVTTK